MIEVKNKTLNNYTFIDLFAGIGGFHYALKSFGAECLFASEWDIHAAKTYEENHKIKTWGDITKIDEQDVPDHDILCAGFPCQSFSISGKQKGFDDIRGTLFFDIARIMNYHKPKVLFLENVKNLIRHNEGKTFRIILDTLRESGYNVYYKVLNASQFGLPQNRERVYIICFKDSIDSGGFKFPSPVFNPVNLYHILEEYPIEAKYIERNDIQINKRVLPQNNLYEENVSINRPLQIGIVNKGGQGERIYHPSGHSITLSANGGGVGAKTGLYLVKDRIRKLSPRECARLQGFPENFITNRSPAQSYKQFGNSVSINVLQYITHEVSKVLNNNE